MNRLLKSLALGILLALPWAGVQAQQVNNYCWVDAGPPVHWAPCNSTNPLAVSGSFTPSGTQNVNLAQILGAAPSLTNPLWVFPATGATFPVSFTGNVVVVGPTADGSAATTPPVLIAGTTDGTGTGTVGVLQVTTTGAATVAGPTADGSPATSAPVLIGGTVDGSASGNVGVAKVDATGLAYNAITNWGGTALGAMANYGTSPGAVLVPGVNAFITNTVAVADTTGAATQAPVAPATATATKSDLIGAQATTAAVNPTNGQQSALSSDTNNNLLVSAGGAPNLATAQVSVTTGNITVAAARALRRAVTITNVTGTGPVYIGNTGVSTSTGTYLGGTPGSSITLNTTAAVFGTVSATTQTVTVVETY